MPWRPLIEQALARYREVGDAPGIAVQLQSLGYALNVIDPGAARGLFAESIEAFRASGSPPMLGGSYVGKGVAELHLRLLDDAVRTLTEGERAFREAGEDNLRFIPIGLLGLAARLQGDHAGAWRRYAEVLNSSHRRGFLLGVSLALVFMADLALVEGKPEPATILAAAAVRLSDELGRTPPIESRRHRASSPTRPCRAHRGALRRRRDPGPRIPDRRDRPACVDAGRRRPRPSRWDRRLLRLLN